MHVMSTTPSDCEMTEMEIFDRVKSLVGVGAPTITVIDVATPLRPGALLRGTLQLQGGAYAAPIDDVQVHLDELRDQQFWRRVASVDIAMDGRVLGPGESLRLNFELIVPLGLTATTATLTYAVVATTEVPGLNPRTDVPVVVVVV